MTEAEPREESLKQVPFVIRAHHLTGYKLLLSSGIPSLTLPSFVNVDRPKIQRLARESRYAEKYYKDVFGETLNEDKIENFRKNHESFHRTFLQLPDDYPVEIAEGVRDGICGGCAIGKHCGEKQQFLGDKLCLDVFLEGTGHLSLPMPTIIYERITFSDSNLILGKSARARKIRVTADIAKKVIKENENPFFYPISMSDLLKGIFQLIL